MNKFNVMSTALILISPCNVLAQSQPAAAQLPEVAIGIAILSFLGVIYTATSVKSTMMKKMKNELKAAMERLELEHENNTEIENLKAELSRIGAQNELQWELWKNINEKNYFRVLENVTAHKQSALELIEGLISVCINGHKVDDERMVDLTHFIVKSSREYRERMKPLFAEIRSKDYERLKEFYRFQTVILLDISRTQEERALNQERMLQHAIHLENELKYFEKMAGALLRPSLMLRSVSKKPS